MCYPSFIQLALMVTMCLLVCNTANPVLHETTHHCLLHGSVQENLQRSHSHLAFIPTINNTHQSPATRAHHVHDEESNEDFQRYLPSTEMCESLNIHNSENIPSGINDEMNSNGRCTATWRVDEEETRIPRQIWHAVCQCNGQGCPLDQFCQAIYHPIEVLLRTDCLHHQNRVYHEYERRTHYVAFACLCQSSPAPRLIPLPVTQQYLPPGM